MMHHRQHFATQLLPAKPLAMDAPAAFSADVAAQRYALQRLQVPEKELRCVRLLAACGSSIARCYALLGEQMFQVKHPQEEDRLRL
jgi:hypothetical protein